METMISVKVKISDMVGSVLLRFREKSILSYHGKEKFYKQAIEKCCPTIQPSINI